MIGKLLASQGLVAKQRVSSDVVPGIVSALLTGGAITRQTRDDRTFIDAYKALSWVYIAVSAIARNGASVPFRVISGAGTKDEQELIDDPRVQVFRRPFPPHLSTYQLFEWTLTSLHLTGKAFWEVQPSFQNPKFIFPIRADLIKPIPDPVEFISGYTFTVQGRTKTIPKENVFYVRFVDPLDDYDGMSPLSAGVMAASTDLTAVKMNLALLENQARPAGVFTTEQQLSDSSFKRLQVQLWGEHRGPTNVGKPLLLESGVKYDATGLPPKDMEFLKGREFSRDEILAIFRVPPTVAGVSAANYATARIEERRFWTQAVDPVLSQLASAIDTAFFPEEDVACEFDLSKVEALQEEAVALRQALRDAFDRGALSTNDYRASMGRPPVR